MSETSITMNFWTILIGHDRFLTSDLNSAYSSSEVGLTSKINICYSTVMVVCLERDLNAQSGLDFESLGKKGAHPNRQ